MKNLDLNLSQMEREILKYLLSEYKSKHSFPNIKEIKKTLNVDYDETTEEKMIIQFIKRGFPQVGLTYNQELVFNYIIEQYSKFNSIQTFDYLQAVLNIPSLDLEEIIKKLVRIGLINRKFDDGDKLIPRISKIGYDHKVILKDGRILKPIEAACVIDALGLPFTYNQDATIFSKDPISNQEIKIEIKEGQIILQKPENIITYLGSQCSTTLFFTSKENLKKWESNHPDQKGMTINIKQALILARRLFEKRLDIDYVPSSKISIEEDQKNIEWSDIPSDNN